MVVATTLLLGIALGGCTAAPDQTPVTREPTASPAAIPAPQPSPETTPTPESEHPDAGTISCDTMLNPEADSALRAQNLVPYPKDYELASFGFEPQGAAIACPWGPPDSAGGGAWAFYTWAEFLPGERDAYLELAVANGYTTEPSADGIWLVPAEEWGGGQSEGTLVTDEWVASADTREQIADIVWAH
jgi:hypothetical protein